MQLALVPVPESSYVNEPFFDLALSPSVA